MKTKNLTTCHNRIFFFKEKTEGWGKRGEGKRKLNILPQLTRFPRNNNNNKKTATTAAPYSRLFFFFFFFHTFHSFPKKHVPAGGTHFGFSSFFVTVFFSPLLNPLAFFFFHFYSLTKVCLLQPSTAKHPVQYNSCSNTMEQETQTSHRCGETDRR